ncbi:MAG: extracellular solute-binding protein [Clostridia bacterium]|nr:extracellular solute-binding protein [Clostridia bacterium]
MKIVKRYLAMLLALVMLLSVAGSAALAVESQEGTADPSVTTPTDQSAPTLEETPQKVEKFSKYKYSEYFDDHAQTPFATGSFTVAANTYLPEQSSANVKVDTQYDSQDAEAFKALNGLAGASIRTEEDSTVVWNFTVPADGLYAINVLYYTVPGKKSDIERALTIDGEQPFTEAGALIFPRTWIDNPEDFKKDDNGDFVLDAAGSKVFKTDVHDNQIRPSSIEKNGWYDINCRDASGNYGDHLYFYLTAGAHTLALTSEREPMVINRLTFAVPGELPTYAQLQEEYKAKGYQNGTDASVEDGSVSIKVQAERPSQKSSTTLYAEYDRTNPAMEPYSYDTIALNEIDGGKFTSPYQWLTWEMDVKEAGLYKIVTRFQQSTKDGTFCNRILYVNGEVPCQEAKHVRFNYDNGWQVETICAPNGEEMYFYFNEGINTITLEVSLGEFGDILDRVDSVVYELNECYRDILMITGSTPDAYRDYAFDDLIPETLKTMEENSVEIKQIVEDIETLVGDSGSFTSSFKTLVQDIDTMTETPRVIAKRLQNFKSNLGTISTWLLNATSQPVSLDWVMLSPVEAKNPKSGKGFFAGVKHQLMMFLASFYMDYDDVGRMSEYADGEKEEIKVWVTTSLDQSQILRSLIDNNQNDLPCKVNLQLVSAATVLPSIAAGTGPDIVLGVGASDPINYAIRGAVMDMSQFDTYDQVLKRFNENAIIPYQYEKNGVKRTYGLPETFAFPMLFYRKDVLSELEIEIPKTWEDVYNCIIKLNMNSMQFGVPGTINTYGTLLYQNGGQFYEDKGNGEAISALDTAQSIQLFQKWTEFFTAYDCLVTYDFANRFRTGETPIGIADYTQYNQLSVFAPEIKGLWGFTNVPGTVQKDGTIDHKTLASGTASVILNTSKHPEEAWAFLDWWTSTQIQYEYGLEIESILGTASRYNTANLEAASQLPWSTADFKAIEEAWGYATALPEYPGSYILGRYINFAFLEVVNNEADPGEQLLDYVKMINEELVRKQAEFAEIQ